MNHLPLPLLFALACLWASAAAQTPAPTISPLKETPKDAPKDPPKEKPEVAQDEPRKSPNPEQEMRELFGAVEKRLRQIDKLLVDASAGDAKKLEQAGASGIERLLKNSRERGTEVLQGIDRILELARQMPQGQGSSSGNGPPQQGDKQGKDQGQSPIDGQGQQSTEREATPDKPDGQKPGDQPKHQDGKKPGQGPTPKNPDLSHQANPQNSPGGPPPPLATDAAARPGDAKDRWGDLPVHARDVFRTEGGGDMPARYRDWIDSYYRRLNKRP